LKPLHKVLLAWAIIFVLLYLVANHLLAKDEKQCEHKCAQIGKDFDYVGPSGRRRPARCRCTRQLSGTAPPLARFSSGITS